MNARNPKAMVLCDTGVISRYLTKKPEEHRKVLEIGLDNICISVVTRTELLNWLGNYKGLDRSERTTILKGIKSIPPIHFNESVSKIYTEFSDRDMVAKPADLIIGATASYYEMPLYTLNKKDFVKFGVRLIED